MPMMMLIEGTPNPPPREAAWIFAGVYGVFALGIMMVGILRMFAGYRIQQFRSRVFGIVANILGFGHYYLLLFRDLVGFGNLESDRVVAGVGNQRL
jgi:hypothetical protein